MNMPASTNSLCRLCMNIICLDYKTLRNENGSVTKIYEITSKYFDARFLNVENGNQLAVMCTNCWQHISDFYNFQQLVIRTQQQLNNENVEEFQIEAIPEVETEKMELESDHIYQAFNTDEALIKTECESDVQLTQSTLNEESLALENEIKLNDSRTHGSDLDSVNDISSSYVETEFSAGEDEEYSQCEVSSNSDNQSESFKIIAKNKPTEVQKLQELDKFIAKHYPKLDCILCSETCSSYSQLQQHFRHRHPLEKCHIVCCKSRLGSRFQIEEHVHLHNDPNAFQCTICHMKFKGRFHLYSHVYAHHRNSSNTAHGMRQSVEKSEEKVRGQKSRTMELDAIIAEWKSTLECVVCTQAFSSFTLLLQHYRQQHPNEECAVYCCGRKFNDRSKLGEHVRYHVDPNAYKCELCDARHKCKRNLYFHIRTYHPQSRDGLTSVAELIKKPPRKQRCITITSREIDNSIAQYRPNLECDLCSESCSTYTLLKTHFRQQHSTVAFYVRCCQRKFNSRSEFENHLRLHFNPSAFKCEICGKCLSSIKKLRAHKKRMHFKRKANSQSENEDVDVD